MIEYLVIIALIALGITAYFLLKDKPRMAREIKGIDVVEMELRQRPDRFRYGFDGEASLSSQLILVPNLGYIYKVPGREEMLLIEAPVGRELKLSTRKPLCASIKQFREDLENAQKIGNMINPRTKLDAYSQYLGPEEAESISKEILKEEVRGTSEKNGNVPAASGAD